MKSGEPKSIIDQFCEDIEHDCALLDELKGYCKVTQQFLDDLTRAEIVFRRNFAQGTPGAMIACYAEIEDLITRSISFSETTGEINPAHINPLPLLEFSERLTRGRDSFVAVTQNAGFLRRFWIRLKLLGLLREAGRVHRQSLRPAGKSQTARALT